MAANPPPPPPSVGAKGKSRAPSLFAPNLDPRKPLRDAVNAVLSDGFMAFLSILLIPLILVPLVVSLSDAVLALIEIGDAAIVVFFIIEYVAKLYLAQDRRAHFRSPWHLLDLAIVIVSIVSYLPIFALNGKGTYALLARLIRLPRALAVAGRTAGSRLTPHEQTKEKAEEVKPTVIRQVDPDLSTRHDDLTWDDLAARIHDGKQEWLDIHNVTPEGISRLSRMLKVPEPHFKSRVVDEIYPHVTFVQQVSFLFLQSGEIRYPERPENFLKIERSGIITICHGPKIITVSPHGLDLFEMVLGKRTELHDKSSFVVSVLYGIQRLILEEYRSVFADIELEVVKVSSMPRSALPRDFLERIYDLNKEVSRQTSNLLHFKQMLTVLTAKKLPLEGFDERAEEDFQVLHEESGFLNEIADDLSDRIQSVIDLYINQEAFETNRILKILAVITSVSVIPAAVSGILGENLEGLPFPAVLWEVVLGMGLGMTFVLYCFIKLGWLKV